MPSQSEKKRVLLSFVGTNDAGESRRGLHGPILTVLKKRNFDEVHLIRNFSEQVAAEHKGSAKAIGLKGTPAIAAKIRYNR